MEYWDIYDAEKRPPGQKRGHRVGGKYPAVQRRQESLLRKRYAVK